MNDRFEAFVYKPLSVFLHMRENSRYLSLMLVLKVCKRLDLIYYPGITEGGIIIEPLTSCFTGLD